MTSYLTGCGILGFNITLPTIKNEKLAKHVYYSIESDCMRLDACADISLSLAGLSYTKALKAYVDLDPCSFVLKVGFESFQITKVLLNYDWGKDIVFRNCYFSVLSFCFKIRSVFLFNIVVYFRHRKTCRDFQEYQSQVCKTLSYFFVDKFQFSL